MKVFLKDLKRNLNGKGFIPLLFFHLLSFIDIINNKEITYVKMSKLRRGNW
jgi:hypothetical protein